MRKCFYGYNHLTTVPSYYPKCTLCNVSQQNIGLLSLSTFEAESCKYFKKNPSIGNHLKNLLIETNSSVHTIRLSISNLPLPMWEDLKTNECGLLVGNRPLWEIYVFTSIGFDSSSYCKIVKCPIYLSYPDHWI